MDKNSLLIIGAGVAVILIAALVFLVMKPSCKEPQIPDQTLYYYGKGEATDPVKTRAENVAIEHARAELVKMIYTDVKTFAELDKYAIAACSTEKEKCSKVDIESYRRRIVSEAALELTGYSVDVKSCKKGGEYRAVAVVYMPIPRAQALLKLYYLYSIIDDLVSSKMIHSAYSAVKEMDTLVMFLGSVPKSLSDYKEKEGRIKELFEKVSQIESKLMNMKVSSVKDVFDFLNDYRELSKIAVDFPKEISHKRDRIISEFNPKVLLKGPDQVIRGELVELEISIPGLSSGNYNFDVKAFGDFPKSVSVVNGKGVLKGYVRDKADVEISLTDAVKSKWSPGAVLDPSLKNAVSVLVSSLEKPKFKVIFLPLEMNPENTKAALYAQIAAENSGWSVESVDKKYKKMKKLLSEWHSDWSVDQENAVFVTAKDDSLIFQGVVSGKLFAKRIDLEKASDDEMKKVALAAIASGHPEIAESFGGYISGVAYYVEGKKDKALSVFEKLYTPEAYLALSRIYYDLGDYTKSVEFAEKALDKFPGQSYVIMGKAFSKINDPSFLLEKLQDLYSCIYSTEGNHPCYYAAASLLYKYGNCRDAKSLILKALDFEKTPNYLLLYGKVLVCLKDYDRAREVVESLKKMKLSPSLEDELERLISKIKK